MKFLSTALFFMFSCNCFAQRQQINGCIVYPYNATAIRAGRVFTQNIGTSPNGPGGTSPFINTDVQNKPMFEGGTSPTNVGSSNTPVDISCYRQPADPNNRECVVRFIATPSPSLTYSYNGGVFAQNYYMCPIDDYIPYTVLFFSILGFFALRKNSNCFNN